MHSAALASSGISSLSMAITGAARSYLQTKYMKYAKLSSDILILMDG